MPTFLRKAGILRRVTLELARRLLATGAIAARDVEAALYLSVVRGVSIARALVDRGVLGERALEEELSRRAGLPLRQVHPASDLVAKLPRGMCRMLAAVPLRHDATSGVTEIAAVDALDGHVASEFMFHLGTPIRVQRATMASIEEAIRRLELAEGGAAGRARRRTPAFPHGAPDTVPPSPPPPSGPITDEVPIPLVRRLSLSATPAAGEEEAFATVPPSSPEPGHDTPTDERSVVTYQGMSPREVDRSQLPFAPTLASLDAVRLPVEEDFEDEVTIPRRKVMHTSPDVPSVSFPSAPPPPNSAAREPLAEAEIISPRPGFAPPDTLVDRPAVERPESSKRHPAVAASEPTIAEAPMEPPPRPTTASGELFPSPAGRPAIHRSPEAGWSPTLPELLDLIGRTRGRDDLLDLVLRAVTLVAHRAAVFVVRREGFMGWSCNPAFGAEEDLRRVVISATQPSIFATSAATGFYLGPIPRTPVHAGLLGVIGRATPDVAVYVAAVRGRPTVVIVADELDDTLLGTRALGEIAKRAGEALTRILSQR